MEVQDKDELKQMRDRLAVNPKMVWDQVDQAERDAIFAYGDHYKTFLDRAKTEREAVVEIERQAKALGFVDLTGKEIIEVYFPMKKVRMAMAPDPEVEAAWQHAARQVIARIRAGRQVAFPTLGDPAIYSTGIYTCQTLLELAPEIRTVIVPGVSAIGACAATAGIPLCQGDDMMAVVPATFDNQRLTEVMGSFQTIVLMKVHRVMDRLVRLLSELDLLEHAVLVERTAQDSERIIYDLTSVKADELHYFSTIIVRKR